MSIVQRVRDQSLRDDKGSPASPPKWLTPTVQYETVMGSEAYGVSSGSSDVDVYGFCIPSRETVFPHLAGHIPGFGKKPQGFDQWQKHHIQDPDKSKTYDVTIYSIVKYFQLCLENNPNMIDSLFTPDNCVVFRTEIATMVRENRRLFLHKGCWHKFKGYAYAQLHKARQKSPEKGSKRYENVQKMGWDTKFGYHVVRLVGEVEQILATGDLDLQQNREQLKAIRRGDVSFEEVETFFRDKERSLESLYNSSSLPYSPNEPAIRELLLNCLEQHYGSLSECVVDESEAARVLKKIAQMASPFAGGSVGDA